MSDAIGPVRPKKVCISPGSSAACSWSKLFASVADSTGAIDSNGLGVRVAAKGGKRTRGCAMQLRRLVLSFDVSCMSFALFIPCRLVGFEPQGLCVHRTELRTVVQASGLPDPRLLLCFPIHSPIDFARMLRPATHPPRRRYWADALHNECSCILRCFLLSTSDCRSPTHALPGTSSKVSAHLRRLR